MSSQNQLRILLSTKASAKLSAMGQRFFSVASRETYPGDSSQWVLYIRACDSERVDNAVRVLSGELQAEPIPSEPEQQADL